MNLSGTPQGEDTRPGGGSLELSSPKREILDGQQSQLHLVAGQGPCLVRKDVVDKPQICTKNTFEPREAVTDLSLKLPLALPKRHDNKLCAVGRAFYYVAVTRLGILPPA